MSQRSIEKIKNELDDIATSLYHVQALCFAAARDPQLDFKMLRNVDTAVGGVIQTLGEIQDKLNEGVSLGESTKVTLTLGQLRRLLKS